LKVVVTRLSRLYFSVICINMILTADAFEFWLFDDGIGKDFSPRRNNCNLIRNPKWGLGEFSTALDFGNGSYTVASRKLGIRGNTHRTVVFWCQPMKEDKKPTIVAWGEKQPMKYFSVEINGLKVLKRACLSANSDA